MQSSSGPPTSTPTSGTVSLSVAVPSSTPQSTLKTVSGNMTNLPTHRVASNVPRNSASGGVRPTISSAITQQSYHVPRGAAAVANIAVPRSASLATPILRGTSSSGNSSNTTTTGVGSTSTISSYAIAGSFRAPTQSQAWEGNNAPRVASPGPLRSVHASPRTPIATYTHPNRSTPAASLTTTTRTTIQGRDNPRPMLAQTSVQKTGSKVQSSAQTSTQLHGPEKTFLKGGVSLQTVRTSVAPGPQPQLVTAPTTHQITVTQGSTSRFSSTGPLNSSVSQPTPPTTLSQTSGPVGLTTSGRTVSLVARSGGPAPQSNQSTPVVTQSTTPQTQPTMVLTTPGTLPAPVLTSATRLTTPAIISGSTSGSRLTGSARIMSQPGGAVISGARLPSSQSRLTYTGATAPLIPPSARLPQAPLSTSPIRVGSGITPTLTSSTRLSVPAAGMVSLQSMVVTNNPTVVTGTGPLKLGHPSSQPTGIRTLPPQSHALSAKPNTGPSLQITSTVVSTGPSSVIGTNTSTNVSSMTTLRTAGAGTSTSSISATTNTTSVTTSSKTVAAYAQTPVTLSTLSGLTSLSARPVAVQSQPISVTKVFPQGLGLGMVGSVGMNVGVAEVSLPVHAMQAVQATSSTPSQTATPGQPSQATSVYIQTAPHRASPGPAGTQLTVDRSSSGYTLPTTTYYLDPSYQMSMANVTGVANVPAGSLVARAGATPFSIQATAAQAVQAVRSGIGTSAPQQVHSLVTSASPVRFNPMMVVDQCRVPVHASIVSAEVDCGVRQVEGELRTSADARDLRQSVIQQFPSTLQRPTSVVQNGGGTTGRAFISAEGNVLSAPVPGVGPAQLSLAQTSLAQTPAAPTTQTQSQQPQVQAAQPVQTQQQPQQTQPPPIVPQQTQPTKPNASPRPSILRKRDIEGSPLKAQRNLTPILASLSAPASTPSSNLASSLPSTAPASPPSPPKRPDSGGHQSSGSTTISATSSPGLNDLNDDSPPPVEAPSAASIAAGLHAVVASGIVNTDNLEPVVKREAELVHEKPHTLAMSPRKKPRKQQLTGNELQEQKFSEDEMEFLSEEKLRKEPKEEHDERPRQSQQSQHIQQQLDQQQQKQQQLQQQATSAQSAQREAYPKRNGLTLLSTYRYSWKSRHNHFLRHSDVRPKDERRPTVSELAAQKYIQQRLNGWKVHHLTTQMEDLAELEMQVCAQLGDVLKLIEKKSKKEGAEHDRDINRVNELIKGNMQRSQVIADGMLEAKSAVMKIFEHRPRVAEIINRSSGKRTFKKREKS